MCGQQYQRLGRMGGCDLEPVLGVKKKNLQVGCLHGDAV